jgi:hypothetical protein
VNVRGKADKMLEVGIMQDAIGGPSSHKGGYAMFGNLFERRTPTFAELLKRTPDWSWNQR